MSAPEKFVEEIRYWHGETVPVGIPGEEYLSLHRQQAFAAGAAGINPVLFFEKTFRELVTDLSQVLDPALGQTLGTQFALGTLEHAKVNAFICRQENEDVYAILVNHGFVTLLNHYLKLVQAANYPGEVVFYQGNDLPGLNRTTYSQALLRLMNGYKETGLVWDPQLKLQLNGTARVMLEFTLRQVYLLLLAHEIGHYVNGDLRDRAALVPVREFAGARQLGQTRHEQEFKADRFAFEAVLRLAARDIPDLPAERVLSASATMLFNIFRGISDRGSDSHPPASMRLLAIVHDFFGDEAAALMFKSFNDTAYIGVMQKHIGQVTVKQLADRHPMGASFRQPT